MPSGKPLGLTEEEMKVRRALLRRIRYNKKKKNEERALLVSLVSRIELMSQTKSTDEIVEELMKDDSFTIKIEGASGLAGYNGDRITRK